jgi:hypothetical protein
MICFHCGAKISNSEINRQRMRNRVGQCSRLWVFRCDKCKKMFNYVSFQQHKELFKKTLIYINEGAEEVARFQALRDAKEAAMLLKVLRDAEEAERLKALRDAEEAERLKALRACRSFSSNIGQCYSFGENLNGIPGFSQSGSMLGNVHNLILPNHLIKNI